MIWDILQAKIEAAGIASEANEDLYLNEMPGDVMVGVMMKSPLSGIRIDPHIPGYFKPVLQFVVRDKDPEAGEQRAMALLRALKIEQPETHAATETRGQVQINMFYPRELPIRYPRLDGNSIEWSVNFMTSFTVQGLLS